MSVTNLVRAMLNGLTPPLVLAAYAKIKHRLQTALPAGAMASYSKLHLACGKNVIGGWANIDLEGNKNVIAWDLTQPLPVASNSVEFIYSEHFIEHIGRDQAKRLLTECHRVLRPGGVLRISTPDLRKLIDEYLAGRVDEWADLGWQPATPCRMLNEGMRLWGHQFVYDADELRRIFAECGWNDLTFAPWRKSTHPELDGLECRPFHNEIIVEAVK